MRAKLNIYRERYVLELCIILHPGVASKTYFTWSILLLLKTWWHKNIGRPWRWSKTAFSQMFPGINFTNDKAVWHVQSCLFIRLLIKTKIERAAVVAGACDDSDKRCPLESEVIESTTLQLMRHFYHNGHLTRCQFRWHVPISHPFKNYWLSEFVNH